MGCGNWKTSQRGDDDRVLDVHGAAPGEAASPLSQFLFETKKGHCELYAGAVAVLLRAAGVRDWQVVTYGNTQHAFTNPAANGSFLSGTLYNEQSDRRSWAAMTGFLEEVL